LTANARFKVNPNWQLLGGVMYDLRAQQVSLANIGIGYIDDCLILAVNYISEYTYNSTLQYNQSVMLQLTLRTIGGNAVTQSLSTVDTGIPGITK
jgi:LPS-assembly protein